jgi:lysophospholipase L1-like esterase
MTDPPPGADEATFTFSNLSGRMPSWFLRLARKLLPGVDKVESEIAPFAQGWHELNIAALGSAEPLWVVLGDSLSQGIGASSIECGWVPQAARALEAKGIHYRVVNLSISGATVTDVIEREIPALKGLSGPAAVVTVLVGSNDILRRELRKTLPARYEELLALLPPGSLVAVTERGRGALGEINRIVAVADASGAVRAVPVRFGSNLRAEDHFHPNDEGYALLAADFAAAIEAHHDASRSS